MHGNTERTVCHGLDYSLIYLVVLSHILLRGQVQKCNE